MKISSIQSLEDLAAYGDVDTSSGCWVWQRATFVNGYGRVGSERAHRRAWEFVNGPIPRGLLVLHKCDVRRCINPEHLFTGTQKDNMHDMIFKGRKVVVSGEGHPMKRDDIRQRLSGDNHWTKRMPDRVASGDRHWSKLHPEEFAKVAFTGRIAKKVSESG